MNKKRRNLSPFTVSISSEGRQVGLPGSQNFYINDELDVRGSIKNSTGSVSLSGSTVVSGSLSIQGAVDLTGDLQMVGGGNITTDITTSVLTLAGGNTASNGANIELYGGAHATAANRAFYDATAHSFRSQDGLTTLFNVDTTPVIQASAEVRSDSIGVGGVGGAFRLNFSVGGTNYGTIFRNDGASTWILLTALNDVNGTWNSLRPFRIDNPTGDITFANAQITFLHSTGDIVATNMQQYLQVRRTGTGTNQILLVNIFSSTGSGGTIAVDSSNGITWSGASGLATIAKTGIYEITVVGYFTSNSTVPMNNYGIQINGSGTTVSTFPTVHSSVDPVERTLNVIRSLAANDTVSVIAQHTAGQTSQVGSTMTIKRIA